MVLISPNGKIPGNIARSPVPFGITSNQGHCPWPRSIVADVGKYLSGDGAAILNVSGSLRGPICWENIFPDIVRTLVANGARFVGTPQRGVVRQERAARISSGE